MVYIGVASTDVVVCEALGGTIEENDTILERNPQHNGKLETMATDPDA